MDRTTFEELKKEVDSDVSPCYCSNKNCLYYVFSSEKSHPELFKQEDDLWDIHISEHDIEEEQ